MDTIRKIFLIEKECFAIYWSENSIQSQLNQDGTVFSLVYDGEDAVGYVIGQVIIDECELLRIAVLEQYRGRGLSNRLMEEFILHCKEKGAKKIFLEVRASNQTAISLYKKYNFKELAVRKNYYSKPNEDAKVFVNELQ